MAGFFVGSGFVALTVLSHNGRVKDPMWLGCDARAKVRDETPPRMTALKAAPI
jgi:hypothetical protein